uniref:Uncharacterized protein n=1 Tax=Angiostrongylus cantonensis TaxID=6313 RepID=A0A0K0CXL8_ANGCA
MTSLALFCIIALKIGWPQNYVAFVKENELDSLQYFAKFTHETSEVSCLWAGFRALYFALVALTLVKNITDYQVDAHHRQHNRYIYPPIPPYPRLVAIPEPVMGNTNPDDPPPYSAIIRDLADSGETAKEETLPPCYSECGRSSSDSPRYLMRICSELEHSLSLFSAKHISALHQLNELRYEIGKAHVLRAEQ